MRFSVIVEKVWGTVAKLVVAYPEGVFSGDGSLQGIFRTRHDGRLVISEIF